MTRPFPFSKWHGLGNDYLLVERAEVGSPLAPELVRRLCDYHFGIGSDGVLEVVSVNGPTAEIVIWNPDGSTAELSGNGTRIAAKWLALRTGVDTVRVRVGHREVEAVVRGDGTVETAIGDVVVGEREELGGITFVPVSVGNPHAVVDGDPATLPQIGPMLESHPRFPNRTNVQVARVDAPGAVTARVWERGVGETASSGTSAVAVAAATHGEGDVAVTFPGGTLHVRLAGGRAWLTGPAEELRA